MASEIVGYSNISSKMILDKAEKSLRQGNVISFKTETVYGLGADATNYNAVEKIYKLKTRPPSNPLIVHFANLGEVEKYCIVNSLLYKIYSLFMPGPITCILSLKKDANIASNVTNNGNTLAIRIPDDDFIHTLLKLSSIPIAAPSANISNKVSSTTAKHVYNYFKNDDIYIVDSGNANVGIESTVIDIRDESKVIILRSGMITKNDLIKHGINAEYSHEISKVSPGNLINHYQPDTKLYLTKNEIANDCAIIFLTDTNLNHIAPKLDEKYKNLAHFSLSSTGQVAEIAKNLYKTLLKVDELNKIKVIFWDDIPEYDSFKGIQDRLIKAMFKS